MLQIKVNSQKDIPLSGFLTLVSELKLISNKFSSKNSKKKLLFPKPIITRREKLILLVLIKQLNVNKMSI